MPLNRNAFGMKVTHRLITAGEQEWPSIIEELRVRRQLFMAIHQMNNIARNPEYHQLVSAAFQRIGLAHAG